MIQYITTTAAAHSLHHLLTSLTCVVVSDGKGRTVPDSDPTNTPAPPLNCGESSWPVVGMGIRMEAERCEVIPLTPPTTPHLIPTPNHTHPSFYTNTNHYTCLLLAPPFFILAQPPNKKRTACSTWHHRWSRSHPNLLVSRLTCCVEVSRIRCSIEPQKN